MGLYTLFQNRKGQVLEPDFLASLLIFSVIIGSFIVTWNTVTSSSTRFDVEEEMLENAERTTNFLVSTPGYPNDWNSENVQIPGFAGGEQNVLDSDKMDEFRDVSYENQSRLLNVRNFYLEFLREDTEEILEYQGEDLDYGQMYGDDARVIVPVERSVLVNVSGDLKPVKMRFLAWRE